MVPNYGIGVVAHSSMTQRDDGKRRQRQLRLRLGFFAVLLTTVVSLLFLLPVRRYMEITSAWADEHVVLGTLGFILVFWVAVPLCLPATALEMMVGSLFGVPIAVVVITIGKTGGSTLAFLLGRCMGKELIGTYLCTNYPAFRAFSEVLNSPSWKPVLLFQLSSIPNLVKVYSLAVTHVSISRFAVSSAIGTLPHAVLWASVGEQATDIAAIITGETKVSTSRMVVVVTGLALTTLAITSLVVYTKRQLEVLQKREGCSSREEGHLIAVEIDGATVKKSTTPNARLPTLTDFVWTSGARVKN